MNVEQREIVAGPDIVRLQIECDLPMFNRFIDLVLRGQGSRETVLRPGIPGTQLNGAPVMLDRLVDSSAHEQNSGEASMRDIAVGRDREGITPERFRIPPMAGLFPGQDR